VMAAGALGTILSAPRLGKLADRIGHAPVICVCLLVSAGLLALQAAAANNVELGILRFLMGLSLGGLLPAITSSIRHTVARPSVGQILGYAISAQYVGQVAGPAVGGFIGGHLGMKAVFLCTSSALVIGAAITWRTRESAVRQVTHAPDAI
jgi:MFS family permease